MTSDLPPGTIARSLLSRMLHLAIVSVVGALLCAAVGAVLALVLRWLYGLAFLQAFGFATVSVALAFTLVSAALRFLRASREADRLKHLLCEKCGNALGTPSGIAGGGGGPVRYRCGQCGTWTSGVGES